MIRISEELKEVTSVAIAGHIRPDGDCVGSTLAFYNYLKDNYPDVKLHIYLEPIAPIFHFLNRSEEIISDCSADETYDLFIALDSSDKERLGAAAKYFDSARRTICIDHHISNMGFADENYIVPDASSASELVFEVIGSEALTPRIAEALYLGIAHDTGVFQYSNTSRRTMEIAGELIATGIPFSKIIDDTFYKKTYLQNQILGRALLESILLLDGKCIAGWVLKKDMDFYGVTPKDTDGIVNQLRVTKGVEVAIFMYETGFQEFKVSLRSNDLVDVAQIASYFGGGGHVKAAGCTMKGSRLDVINNLTLHIEAQLKAAGEKKA